MKIKLVTGHADRHTKEHEFTNPEQLKIQVDLLCGEKAQPPIQTHILNTPIAVYIGKTYYPNKYAQNIHNHCGYKDAKGFIKEKNEWTAEMMALIDWKKSARFIGKQTYATKKDSNQIRTGMVDLGKEKPRRKTIYPFRKEMEDETTSDHDYFSLCPASRNQKEERLESFNKLLTNLRTPDD